MSILSLRTSYYDTVPARSVNRTVAKILRFYILQVEGMSLSILTLSTPATCKDNAAARCTIGKSPALFPKHHARDLQENTKRESRVSLHESEHLEILLFRYVNCVQCRHWRSVTRLLSTTIVLVVGFPLVTGSQSGMPPKSGLSCSFQAR